MEITFSQKILAGGGAGGSARSWGRTLWAASPGPALSPGALRGHRSTPPCEAFFIPCPEHLALSIWKLMSCHSEKFSCMTSLIIPIHPFSLGSFWNTYQADPGLPKTAPLILSVLSFFFFKTSEFLFSFLGYFLKFIFPYRSHIFYFGCLIFNCQELSLTLWLLVLVTFFSSATDAIAHLWR